MPTLLHLEIWHFQEYNASPERVTSNLGLQVIAFFRVSCSYDSVYDSWILDQVQHHHRWLQQNYAVEISEAMADFLLAQSVDSYNQSSQVITQV